MVAPPTAFMDFSAVSLLTGLKAVITGSRDDIAPPEMLTRLTAHWNPDARLEILPGADHFFFGHLTSLEGLLVQILRDVAADPAGAPVA
jgi:alpha/beta superfamily hydrolase